MKTLVGIVLMLMVAQLNAADPVEAPPMPAPIEAPVAAPIEAPVAAPIEAPVAAPIEAPVAPPVAAPVVETPTPVMEVTAQGIVERYYSQDTRYSVAFPGGWELAQNTDKSSLAGISPQEDESDTFRENVLIGSFKLTGTDNLDSYFNGNMEYLKEQIPDLEVEETMHIKVDGNDAIKVVYTSTISDTRVKTMQVFMIKDGLGYIITAMAQEAHFGAYAKTFEEVIDSFRFE